MKIIVKNFSFLLLITAKLIFTDSSSAIYQYRIYCKTEQKNVYVWSETPPTKCPNNTADVINANSISIVDERNPNSFSIKAESVPTGGHFRAETLQINASAGPGVLSTLDVSWPFNISVLQISFVSRDENSGDIVSAEIPSDALFGFITQDVNPGDVTINVTDSVFQNSALGFYVKLSDGINTDALGRIINIDPENKTITLEMSATYQFLANQPTSVLITVAPINNFILGPAREYLIGQSSLAASHIPANLPAKIKYLNNGATPKTLIVTYEYLY